MTTTELALEPTQTVSYDENILNFLDYTVLILSQINSANDVDIVMDDFLSDDFIDLLCEHKGLFSVLAPIWFDVFTRVFISGNETSFSLKSLWIPILINKLGWKIEDNESVKEAHRLSVSKVDDTLYSHLTVLFIEGILYSPEEAFSKFKLNTETLISTSSDAEDIHRLYQDVSSLGW